MLIKNIKNLLQMGSLPLWPSGWFTHLGTQDIGSNPGTGRYIVVWMTNKNGSSASLSLFPVAG